MSMFKSLLDKFGIKPAKTKEENKKLFFQALCGALEDGVLTNDEIDELDGLRDELGLSEEDTAGMRVRAFQVAVNCATADGLITPKEEKDLQRIKAYLNLGEGDVARNRGTLNKMRVLFEIHRGNLPVETIPGLGLSLGEMAHLAMKGLALEERPHMNALTVPGRTAVVVTRGKPFRMGAGRMSPLPEDELQPGPQGELIITSHRAQFNAGPKSFTIKYERMTALHLYTDGFAFLTENAKPKFVRFEDRSNLELATALMSRFLNPPPPKPEIPKPHMR